MHGTTLTVAIGAQGTTACIMPASTRHERFSSSTDTPPQTHSGVKTQFSNHFVRTGILDEELSAFYGKLMEARLDSDYEASFDPDPAQLRAWVPKAEAFIDRIIDLLDSPSS